MPKKMRRERDEVPSVVPPDDATEPDFSTVEATPEPEPEAAIVPKKPHPAPAPVLAPQQSLVNVHVHGRNAIVNEEDGPKDSDREMGDIFGNVDEGEKFNPLSELLSEDDINMKTDLTPGLIIAIARCEVAADLFEVPELRDVCHAIKTMRVSLGRKGRTEIVEAIKGHPPQDGTMPFFQKLKQTLHT